MKRFVFVVASLAMAGAAQSADLSAQSAVVRTADDAIRLAYVYWRAIAPDGRLVEEEKWKAGFEAVRRDGIWCVAAKRASGQPATFGMYVGEKDGRYLGAFDLGTPQSGICGTANWPKLAN